MTEKLEIHRLTKAAFAAFGNVIEADPSTMRLINGGYTERYHALSSPQVIGEPLPIIFNIFRSPPRPFPYEVTMMERHPFASQSFTPLSGHPFLVAVSEDVRGVPGKPRVFLVGPHQGINYSPNVWHHPLMALQATSDFLVIDRENPQDNYEEFFFPEPYLLEEPRL
ncbi:ureidoglycolate lyase [Rhizobium deserti]|uniref:Ureidoglycolate lyase n=1 Tax=Rhizobium deserti TaxID=2547961 RepID=A0A4R5UMP0_9HYPH|nr:ureidoglycolate lyase [Rhizobium deserti]TDK39111.1 ureidoglycolate lyase [Rhizobium deserti]